MQIDDLLWRLQYAKKQHVALMNKAQDTEKVTCRDCLERRAKQWEESADEMLEKIKELTCCEQISP